MSNVEPKCLELPLKLPEPVKKIVMNVLESVIKDDLIKVKCMTLCTTK